jgi:hypothetical protein
VTVGTCTIRAAQAGDANYNAAANVDQSFSIAKANQTITFGALSDKTFGDADFGVSATASSGLTVAFSSLTPGTCTVTGSTVHIVTVGTCTIRAAQAGDANYNAAANVDQSFSIAKANQTITFGALGDKTFGDADFGVSATASSGLTVAFSSLTPGTCTVTGSTVHIVTVGTCTIRADQAGNASYNAAPQVQQSFAVTAPPIGTVTITKMLNDGGSGFTGSFQIILTCVPTVGLPVTTTVLLNGGLTTLPIVVPLGSTCTVTEPTFPTPPSGFSWGTVSIVGSPVLILTSGGNFPVTVTNTLTPVGYTGTLKIKKTVSGAPSGFSGTFGFNIQCGSWSTTATINYPAETYEMIPNVPVGSCTVTENVMTGLPSNYVWGTPSYSPSATVTIVKNTTTIVTVTNTAIKQQAPKFTSSTSCTFYKGQSSSFTVTVTGSPTPTVSTVSTLPPGVSFNSSTRKLTGTPTARGTWTIIFTATNGVLPNATQTFTLKVQ